MIILLSGKDTYRSRKKLREFVEQFKKTRDPQGFNVTYVDCLSEKEPGKILESMLALPFLAERRMVVIENLIASKHDVLHKSILERIEAENFPKENVIIFWEAIDKVRKKAPKQLLERLAKEQYSQRFDVLDARTSIAWVEKECQQKNIQMDRNATQYLVTQTKQDSWHIATLLEQLESYKDGSSITLSDVQLFVAAHADDNIFNLVDSILAEKKDAAFAMMREQYNKGEDAQFIFSMLLRQCKILLQMKDLEVRGELDGTAAKKLNLHPFVIKKSTQFVRRYSREKLVKLYSSLLSIDHQTKTGQHGQSLLLDVVVAKCAS